MMKKLLLGSTALAVGGLIAAPAMAADPIKIGVGGYYSFFAITGSVEGVYALNGTSIQYKGLNFYQEGEIHFIGQSKLDNGTTIGIRVELEGWNPPTTAGVTAGQNRQIDDAGLRRRNDLGARCCLAHRIMLDGGNEHARPRAAADRQIIGFRGATGEDDR